MSDRTRQLAHVSIVDPGAALVKSRGATKEKLYMDGIETAIRAAYADFDAACGQVTTADDILCDPELEDRFWSFFESRNPTLREMGRVALNQYFLRLRKRGAKNGGLICKTK